MIKYPLVKEKLEAYMVLNYYNRDELCSSIFADEQNRTVEVINYTDDLNKRAFGINRNPSWADFENFLESRCFPRDRQALKLELKQLGLTEYNPLEICKVTSGKNYKDEQWLEIEDEREVEYDDSCERG